MGAINGNFLTFVWGQSLPKIVGNFVCIYARMRVSLHNGSKERPPILSCIGGRFAFIDNL